MRRIAAFLRRHLLTMVGALVLLTVAMVLWIFSASLVQWNRSVQSFDAVAFLGEHLLAVAMLGGCLLIFVLTWLPKWQAARPELTPQAQFEVENNARKTLAEIVGGAALLAGLYFTWSSLEVSREGQITDRFTKAIAQLGEQGPEKLAVQLGGIYALARIAKDSKDDHWPIMEVLTAYVRETAPSLPKPPKDAQPSKGDQSPQAEPPTTQEQRPPRPAADIQAILTVFGRRTHTYGNGEQQPLNLANADLRGANLMDAQLQEAILTDAQLQGAILMGAQLQGAILMGAQLQKANLWGAQLQEAILTDA